MQNKKSPQKWAFLFERAMGIEPTYEAWEASILPLNYARILYGRPITPIKSVCNTLLHPQPAYAITYGKTNEIKNARLTMYIKGCTSLNLRWKILISV